jgi:hypothetical protein
MPPTTGPGTGSHIPSSTACESCHLASLPAGLIPASAAKSAPGTGFATPAPSGAQIHSGVTSGCSACHEAGYVWMGVGAYPISPTTLVPGALYNGFQTRPRSVASANSVADPAHPLSGDCSQCHGNTTAFSGVDKPANHIPYAASAQCNSCHTSTDYGVLPSLASIHANAQSTTSNCVQCHGPAAASFAIPAVNFSIVGLPSNHIPTATSCEVCHVGAGSSITALPVGNGAKFSGSLMNHAGIGSNCVSCHVTAGTQANFVGIGRIVGMPATSPPGAGSHIPSGTACESCHLATLPTGLIAASATKTAPGTGFSTPAPSGAQIHAGVTGNCSSCHESGFVWMGVGAYPISPSSLVAGAQYKGFQTRPRAAGSTYSVPDPAHPSTGDCSQCHGNTNAFTGVDKPANHIPYASSAQCSSCHTSSDYAVMPTLANIHAYAPSTTNNCAQCHGAAAPSFAIPAINFSIVGLPSNHIPTSLSCEACHVGADSSIAALPVGNGAKFSGSTMNHTGISTNCNSCHLASGTSSSFAGITSLIGMPPTSPPGANSHIPSSTVCESCHLGSRPTGPVAASASNLPPGTGFATPAPTGAQIHAGVTGGCSNCHEGGFVWMGVSAYPISPNAMSTGAQYKGFQTRPRATASTYSVADPAHPSTGDCSQCHGSTSAFTGVDVPANHIPYASNTQCNACHTSSNYATMPTLANIHANAQSTTGNCAQCHGPAANGFAIPAANFSIVGLPSNHIPTTASCELCHVGAGSSITVLPVGNGAKFSGSLMNHSGIASNCVACHVTAGTAGNFAGIGRIVGMPPTSPPGSSSHIPSSTACESCHIGSLPAGLIPASATKTAPGTGFSTPSPTGAQIHAGVTGGCSSCHDTGFVWMGVGAYPISPISKVSGAQYKGFQTRPVSAASTYSVADASHPLAGDCSNCHGNTTAFTGVDVPANHIPYAASAQCNACHTGTDYSVLPTLANIHANAQSTTTNCVQCHGPAAASFALPAANFSIVGLPSNHIPTAASCEVCHVGQGSSITALPVGNAAKFSGSLMNHSGISTNCENCHVPAGSPANFAGIARIVGMPPTAPMGTGSHIPSGNNCASCHLGSVPAGLIAASATKTAPGTGFSTPAPTGAQIHAGVSSGCSSCHETGFVWMGVGAYTITPKTKVAGAQYKGFQTRPVAAASTFSVADAAHPRDGDCSRCHGNTTAFSGTDVPSNHIPFASSAQCTSCHTSSDYSTIPTLTNIHANAPSTTSNCAQCHGAAAPSFANPAAGFAVVGMPPNHIPTSTSCETCHVGPGSSVAATPVVDGARFSGSMFSHQGISSNCVACHLPKGQSTSFYGISSADILHMPSTSPPGPDAHIPSSTTCETCHLGSMPAGLIPAQGSRVPPGSGFANPPPTSAMIHTGVSGGCNACHEASSVWVGMGAYPISPTTLTAGAQYRGFHTRPRAAGGTHNIADASHPSTGDCSACHVSTTAFVGVEKPSNHIPYAASAQCNACHTGANYATPPTLTAIHANAPSTTGNCAQCHGAAATSFAIPSSGFAIVGLPTNHVPTTASCETCHVGSGSSIAALPVVDGAKFSGSLMSHAGITSNCVSCHVAAGTTVSFAGISRIIGMPPTSPVGAGSHIPSSTSCESCHLGSLPAGLVPASATATAPGSAFAVPAPTSTQIHAGVTSGCSSCHEAGNVWMGMNAYPISPSSKTTGALYRGFQTRPRAAGGTFNVADAAHPNNGDCSACHSSTSAFSGIDKPANHIPYSASAQCNSCHTSTDYAVMPTLTNIHAFAPSTTSNCAQCHGAAASSFAIPSANFAIVGIPSNHIPTTASCEVCHVGAGSSIAALPVVDGAKFSGSLMNHSGIASNCAACHQPAGSSTTFAGIARIVGMPPTTPVGSSSHIPSSTTCETCHLGSLPAGLIAASASKTAPGTGFATPAPSGAQIHSGVTSGCSACHEAGYVWMGVGAYPISPSSLVPGASYKGFQTRPRAAGSTYGVADPAHPSAGDCSQCHANTTAFTGIDLPGNHIPYTASAQCTSCHTSSDYSVMPTLANIHANAQSTSSNCVQCHGPAAASFAIPAANFSIVGLPANHIPTAASCEVCHVAAGSSITALPVGNGAKFSGSLMNHTGINGNCVACHQPAGSSTAFAGITRIVGMPPTSPPGASSHIPSSTTCESCHLATRPTGMVPASATLTAPGTAFATPAPTGSQIHAGVTNGCSSCHESGFVWMGMGAYPINPSTLIPGTLYTGFQTRPRAAAGTFNVSDAAHPSSGDCSACHHSTSAFSAIDKPSNHIPYSASASCDDCHTSTNYSVMPTLTNIHAFAPSTTTNCTQCHGAAAASFAIPSAGFTVVGLPSNHLPTTMSCEVCHVGPGSSISTTPVVDGAKFSRSLMNHAGITSNCVSCHVPSGTSASFAGVAKIIGMPPTSPAGAGSHIPSSTTCEACHLGTVPTGYIAASATKSAPGTAFLNPPPTGAQIHAGVSSGCSACHESAMVWMGVSAYPITPTLKTAGAQYKGFQTRPRSAAGTYNVADPTHPLTDDCSKCHGNTTAFTGVDMPANHIPFSTTAQCNSCHTNTNYSVMPSLANIHAYAQSTTGNCAQCHGAAAASFAIPSAGFSIVGLPSDHIPTGASCEVCHVGTGSSIAATPVGNGAKFSGSRMSHAGITSNCVACHVPAGTAAKFAGITSIIGMPVTSPMGANSHIPSSTTCEACHSVSSVPGLIPASATKTAPGTLFSTPVPTGAQIHAGVTSGCSGCHESGYVWMGMSVYPISPTSVTSGAQYKGFQTRPRATGSTYNVVDAGHPTTGDCSLCHLNTTAFGGVDTPSNHIPYKTGVACTACHTSTNYATMPTLANIHANAQSTTANCSQCHGATASTFAIPSANFSIVGLPNNHIPTAASCEVCHVGTGSSITTLPVGNGAKFSKSLMSHSGITSNCVVCHVKAGTVINFAGITSIVGMPPTSPVGANSHIPSSTTCENCHSASSVPGLIPASATKTAPGTLFNTPVPTGAQIHAGITSGCNACHETGYVWMGMSAYPISPTTIVSGAQYKGFQTRPRAAAGTFNIVDAGHPATGDCSACHTGTAYFDGAAKPTGHIPTTGNCSTCHIVSGNFTITGLASNAVLHTGIKSGCRTCHAAGPFAGSGQVTATAWSAACTTTALPYQPTPMPPSVCATPPATFSATYHIPVGTAACELCHGTTNFTTFKMSSTTAMRPGTTTGPVPGTTMHTAGVPAATFTCMSCHETPYKWYGVSIKVRDGANHYKGQDCDGSGCHRNTSSSFRSLLRPVPVRRAAVNGALPRMLPFQPAPEGNPAAQPFNHSGVTAGQCQTCHNGQMARGRPVKHFGQRMSCDSCHRTSSWLPAQYGHPGVVAGQCAACHNGTDASGKPGPHFVTVRACDSCHRPLAWKPANYQHLSPAYQPALDKPRCVDCHVTNGEVIPRQLHGNPRTRPVPVPSPQRPGS